MSNIHPHIQKLVHCIELEEKEEVKRYSLDEKHNLKTLKREGLAIHPIRVTNKTFGYADYPEISFRINFPAETKSFRDGCAIEYFVDNETPIKGILLNFDGKKGEVRLFAPDYPDWLEDDGVGIKLAPDQRTTSIMKQTLRELRNNKKLYTLFENIHGNKKLTPEINKNESLNFFNTTLNVSQQKAVQIATAENEFTILHGPPGTGKTTTLIEIIQQLAKQNKKILVSAPSNTAVDNIAKGLIKTKLNILRVGNTTKVNEDIFAHTPEGKLQDPKIKKELKDLKIRAEQFRKMALQYKRKFGKSEREQRNLLFAEVKNIRTEIKKLQLYYEKNLFENAHVVLGTPIGLQDTGIKNIEFETLIIDEAGQCLEPLAWCIFGFAKNIILAGDHLQLPPTVLSSEAEKLGFNVSILESCFASISNIHLLNTQYRMRKSIANFSSSYFYNNELKTPEILNDTEKHIYFIDTAGSGYNETTGQDGISLMNQGELDTVKKIMEYENLHAEETCFISPYSGQASLAKEQLAKNIRISTIDSFQGQEHHTIIVSLVRSNDDGIIGFLNDYRRMNVAITRAKEKLFVIGDSATLANDKFFKAYIDFVEKNGEYKSVWEYL